MWDEDRFGDFGQFDEGRGKMKKCMGLILILVIFSATMTPVFAIRMIDFIRDRNEAASVTTTTVTTTIATTSTIEPPENWITPFMAYVRVRAKDGTLVNLHGWTGTLSEAKLKLKLFTYMGTTKIYGYSALYMKGTLDGGDNFFASIYIPSQEVEVYEFSEDRIYFNIQDARLFIVNYNTGERTRVTLDTTRFDVMDGITGTVNGAGGSIADSDSEFRISGMDITEFDYRSW